MATVIRRAVDGVPFVLEATPDLDLDAYASELVTLFDLATRRGPVMSIAPLPTAPTRTARAPAPRARCCWTSPPVLGDSP